MEHRWDTLSLGREKEEDEGRMRDGKILLPGLSCMDDYSAFYPSTCSLTYCDIDIHLATEFHDHSTAL